jgi:exonuclease VII small subunit
VTKAVGELGYAEAAAELDAIIAELDQGLIDVDLLETKFQRAIEIVEELDRRIRSTRDRVAELAPRLEAVAGGSEAGVAVTRPTAARPAAARPDPAG